MVLKAYWEPCQTFKPLMSGGNKKVTYLNKPAAERSAAGLFKYVWPFCYHQALKG